MKDKPIFTHPVTFTGIDFNWGTNSETVYVPAYAMDFDSVISTDFFDDEIADSNEKVDARCCYWQYDEIDGGESEYATDEQLEYIKEHWDELDDNTLTLLETSAFSLSRRNTSRKRTRLNASRKTSGITESAPSILARCWGLLLENCSINGNLPSIHILFKLVDICLF